MEDALLSQFINITGTKYALTRLDDLTHYCQENRGLFIGKTPLVLKPANTKEVSEIVKLAAQSKTAIVPQGGHTGHVGGGVPDESETQIIVSLERMNEIREIDLKGNVIICDAGVILETIQRVADDHERLFPLALGSQGSCQIGGNISTNAGGTGVLAYGNMRELVMGLEVVLPSGEIWQGLRRLKKDNTGYNLRNLFVGAEGTLGIITAAVLKLFPKPKGKSVCLCGLNTPSKALSLFNIASAMAGASLTAFELMAQTPLEFTFKHIEGVRNPLSKVHPWQVLMEVSSNKDEADANQTLETIMENAYEQGLIVDASIASSFAQNNDFWRIRETMPLAQKPEGGSMKHDISVPIHEIPQFLALADKIIQTEIPQARICAFGHMGDGNIHYNISQPVAVEPQKFLSQQPYINKLIHDLVVEMNGSVAAEHGVGKLKRNLIARTKDPVELALMHSIKQTLDPDNIMNPGKVV